MGSREGDRTLLLCWVCAGRRWAWTCSLSLRPAPDLGTRGGRGNSTLPASSLLWGQVVRTPDFFTSSLPVTGFDPPPPPRVPGQRGEIEAFKEGSTGRCQCVQYVCLDGLRHPPTAGLYLLLPLTRQHPPLVICARHSVISTKKPPCSMPHLDGNHPCQDWKRTGPTSQSQ